MKTKLAMIAMIGPRLVDPKSKTSEFIALFRYVEEQSKVEDILKTRVQQLNSAVFSKRTTSTTSAGGRGGGGGLQRKASSRTLMGNTPTKRESTLAVSDGVITAKKVDENITKNTTTGISENRQPNEPTSSSELDEEGNITAIHSSREEVNAGDTLNSQVNDEDDIDVSTTIRPKESANENSRASPTLQTQRQKTIHRKSTVNDILQIYGVDTDSLSPTETDSEFRMTSDDYGSQEISHDHFNNNNNIKSPLHQENKKEWVPTPFEDEDDLHSNNRKPSNPLSVEKSPSKEIHSAPPPPRRKLFWCC